MRLQEVYGGDEKQDDKIYGKWNKKFAKKDDVKYEKHSKTYHKSDEGMITKIQKTKNNLLTNMLKS